MKRMYHKRDYVRMMGLKLLLLGVCFSALGAALSMQTGMPIDQASWGGMKLLHLILGTMGAGVSLFFLPQFSTLALGRTVFAGVCCAVVGTPFLVALYSKYMGEPLQGAENVLAALLGVLGVYLIPGAQALGRKWRDNPWGFIDRIRGRGPGGQP